MAQLQCLSAYTTYYGRHSSACICMDMHSQSLGSGAGWRLTCAGPISSKHSRSINTLFSYAASCRIQPCSSFVLQWCQQLVPQLTAAAPCQADPDGAAISLWCSMKTPIYMVLLLPETGQSQARPAQPEWLVQLKTSIAGNDPLCLLQTVRTVSPRSIHVQAIGGGCCDEIALRVPRHVQQLGVEVVVLLQREAALPIRACATVCSRLLHTASPRQPKPVWCLQHRPGLSISLRPCMCMAPHSAPSCNAQ